jgi:hypothetical protein
MITDNVNYEMSDTKPCFIKTYALNQIPKRKISKRPIGIIVNLDPIWQEGSHWIGIFVDEKNNGNYFDSFGFPITKQEILNFFKVNNVKNILYNKYMLQHVTSSTCGPYCILFLKMRCNGFSLNEFLKLFSTDLRKNDLLAIKILE